MLRRRENIHTYLSISDIVPHGWRNFFRMLEFVAIDKTPPHWDYAGHLVSALDCRDFFLKHQYGPLVSSYNYYPPFLYYVMAIFFVVFTYSKTIIVFL